MRFKSLVLCFLIPCVIVGAFWSGLLFWIKSSEKSAAQEMKEAEAREKTAFHSLEDRIPQGKPIPLPKPFSEEAAKRWDIMESNIEFVQGYRAVLLKALHEKTRKFFVESPGFGAGRMLPDEYFLMLPESSPPPQPGYPATFGVAERQSPLAATDLGKDLYLHYMDSVFDFLDPSSFGYVKDRKHVAGFKSHGFRYLRVPEDPSQQWRVHHVLLIGLLVHEKTVVYLSDNLPSMEQVRTAQTRPLDLFEETGMEALRGGEDLHAIQQGDTLRMVGAVRATKQCQQCHDTERGDMLGAFTYTLRTVSSASPYRGQ